MFKSFKEKYIDNNRYLFIITSILYGLCFIVEKPHGDDVEYYLIESGLFSDMLDRVLLLTKGIYTTVTNIYVMYLINRPLWLFILSMIVSMYILLESLRVLFSKGHKHEKYINIFIAFAACTYSFIDFASSGWRNCPTSYFIPLVFLVNALIPIKKVLNNEKFEKYEYVLYLISMYLGADNPQGTFILLFLYTSFTIYLLINKKKEPYIIVLFLFTVLDLILFLTSKRYEGRTFTETYKRFPVIGMVSFLGKVDLGLFGTIRWIFFGDHTSAISILILFAIVMFAKYKNKSLRIISLIPIALCLLFRNMINNNLSLNAYDLLIEEFGSSNYALFNVESVYSINTYIQYVVMFALMALVIYEFYLLTDNVMQFIIIMFILAAGFGSRMMMAFSPTVFASHLRPFIYLAYSIIIVMIMIYRINIDKLSIKTIKIVSYASILVTIANLGYFFLYVYNYLGSSFFDLFK